MFVTVFANRSCSQDKFVMPLHLDTRSYPQFKFCTWTNMWLRPTLHRDTAPLPISYNGYQDYDSSTYINCTAITPAHNKHYAMTAKTRAIPVLHRDYFPAKIPRYCPDTSPGNTTSLYCRAVISHSWYLQIIRDNEFEDIACMSVS